MDLADRPLTVPSASRLATSAPHYREIVAAHQAALEDEEDGYDDPVTGLFVFTAAFLASRDCCDLGCRHCPYCK